MALPCEPLRTLIAGNSANSPSPSRPVPSGPIRRRDRPPAPAPRTQLVEALDGMVKKFPTPYIIFYPFVSRDGMPFPVNKCIREIQGHVFDESRPWCGNLVVAKYRDTDYSAMTDASMADFPIIKNYLSTHLAPS